MSPIYKRDRVQFDAERPRESHAHATSSAPVKAARLIEIGGVVRAIEVTCTCGERTVVELEFANPTAAPTERHA